MLAMQYTIQLPHGYDMNLIRARVKERIALFENLPGLAHKSYLMNEADRIYAPFYVWNDFQQARGFMLNDLFRGVVQSFSRPRVRNWTILDHRYGNASITPGYAVREADIIPQEEALDAVVKREMQAQAKLLENDNLFFHVIALDPDRWELMRFSLWRDRASAFAQSADMIQTYDVLHVSGDTSNEAYTTFI